MPFGYYLFKMEVKDKTRFPVFVNKGKPYSSSEHQKAEARLLLLKGEEVYYLDVWPNGMSMGIVLPEDQHG